MKSHQIVLAPADKSHRIVINIQAENRVIAREKALIYADREFAPSKHRLHDDETRGDPTRR